MAPGIRYAIRVAFIVAPGGFLMGFDVPAIYDVVGFIEPGLVRPKDGGIR